jgi:hypothetical protein
MQSLQDPDQRNVDNLNKTQRPYTFQKKKEEIF